MSTIKDPERKKRLSLARDRRNRYGENSKSSRKNIQRGKQRRHMDERRSVAEVLGRLRGHIQEDEATEAELSAKSRITDSKQRGFKKKPDTPLGEVLVAKRARAISKRDKPRS
jgi:ATP phosphoribosyltransferase regulatory subunit HisZ